MTNDTATTQGELLDEVRRISIAESRHRGLDLADAEDLAQQISVKYWLQMKKDKRPKSITAWTRTSTRNLIVDGHRKTSLAKHGAEVVETLTDIDESRFLRS